MKHGVKLCNYISPTSVGESVQLFSRLAQAALATLIYPVKIVDERSLLRLFDVPRRVVNRREDSLDREGGCVHKCAAIHRNLCCIANRILSPPPLLFYLFFSPLPPLPPAPPPPPPRAISTGSDENRLPRISQ